MKKNLTKKLMLSVLTLAFAVVSLGASTFAWFTTSENATVKPIDYNVTGNAGLEIAVSELEGKNITSYYIDQLPTEVIEGVINGTGFTQFNAVSYYSGVKGDGGIDFTGDFFHRPTYVASEGEDGKQVYEAVAGAKLNGTDGYKPEYIAFELHVKVDAEGWVTLNVPYLKSDGADSWASGVTYQDNEGTQTYQPTTFVKYDVLSASRLAVVPGSNVLYNAVACEKLVLQAPAVPATASAIGNSLGFSKLDKAALAIYNAKYAGDENDSPACAESDISVAATGNEKITFKVANGGVYTFQVYIWIEGNDAECANAIFSQKLISNFSFNYSATDPNAATGA